MWKDALDDRGSDETPRTLMARQEHLAHSTDGERAHDVVLPEPGVGRHRRGG
jgi:hypothetical protein